jgi:alkanesulfonate monooxygenase SsuD/methylene tetrahydromethanopterin reductase-like flavin-dependent oxidoreductase (luciferase family)
VDLGLTLPSFVAGTDRATTLEWCRRIDDGPFTTIAVGERTAFHSHEMFATLAFAAAATERVRIAATVAVVPTHDTVRIAKQVATIDVLSGGRFTLGVGVGGREQDYRALSTPFRQRFARLDEQIDAMRRIWRGEAVIEGVPPIGPRPVQPGGPPIYTSSMGPKSLARSARWADGIAGFSLGPDPAEVRATFDAVRAAWVDAGRATAPALTTSSWYSLADDGPARLRIRWPTSAGSPTRARCVRPSPASRRRAVRSSCSSRRAATSTNSTGCSPRSPDRRGGGRRGRAARGCPVDGADPTPRGL